jgi:ferredoxin
MGDRIRVNPILCSGHGLCAELLPELITLDEWGYPIVSGEPIPEGLDKLARRAMTDCPALALVLVAAQPATGPSTPLDRRSHDRPAPLPVA